MTSKLEDITKIKTRKTKLFLIFESFLLFTWIIIQITRKIVGIIRDKPPNPNTKFVPNLSNANDENIVEPVNTGIDQIKKL